MIDLYYYTSPNVRKVLITLEELGLPYRINWTDITAGEQFADDYLLINPNGKVPAIVDADGPAGQPMALFESNAILLYLAEKTGRLLPQEPAQRWNAIAWLHWQGANQGPLLGQATHFTNYAPQQGIHDEYATTRYQSEALRLYSVMNTRLTSRDFLADEFSIADIACFPWVRVASGQGVSIGDFPAVAAWSERIANRPAAKVRVSDPREEKARRNEYTAEQFKTLMRSGPGATNKEGTP